jgi:hypothetical protein
MQSRQSLTTSRKSLGSDRDTGKVGLTVRASAAGSRQGGFAQQGEAHETGRHAALPRTAPMRSDHVTHPASCKRMLCGEAFSNGKAAVRLTSHSTTVGGEQLFTHDRHRPSEEQPLSTTFPLAQSITAQMGSVRIEPREVEAASSHASHPLPATRVSAKQATRIFMGPQHQ